MQFVLTEEEYNSLKGSVDTGHAALSKTLQDLCTQVADLKPIEVESWQGWGHQPWGCVHSADIGEEWYCDHCPVQDVCPSLKHWSK
jgi:hypothetical protein